MSNKVCPCGRGVGGEHAVAFVVGDVRPDRHRIYFCPDCFHFLRSRKRQVIEALAKLVGE